MGTSRLTVETFLKKRFGLSEKAISRIKFAENGILLKAKDSDGFLRVRTNRLLAAGDQLRISMPERIAHPDRVPPVTGTPDILYEDEDYIALNKPAGMVTHPTHGHHRDTLANLLAGYYKQEECSCKVLGRLDKETSGVVLFGKHRLAVSRMQQLQKDGTYEKTYLALALWPDPGTAILEKEYCIQKPIGPAPGALMRQEIKRSGEGKDAVTLYRIRKVIENASLLEVRTVTGRTHQIRVHLASEGHPLLGDALYGMNGSEHLADRTMLHAWKISFLHPFTGEPVTITAPLPDDLTSILSHPSGS